MGMVRLVLLTFLFLTGFRPVWGGIYVYRDHEGVLHLTNIPPFPDLHPSQETFPPEPVGERYREVIETTAKTYGLDPALISAIIEVESRFDPLAVSRKGARGLMQLMPETARELGIFDVFDPKANIEGGVRYLRYLLDRFGGDLALALAAYNAGEKAILRYGGIPPYRETEEYVARVLTLYRAKKKKGRSDRPSTRIYRYLDGRGSVYYTNLPPLYPLSLPR